MFSSDFTRSLLEKIGGNSATLVLDSSGMCVFSSSNAINVLGKTDDELTGLKFTDAFPLYLVEGKLVEEHMHPAINLRGHGRQSLKFPCFYFTKEYCVLPAFSKFSGHFCVSPEKDEKVFAVVENGLMQLP